MRRWIGALPLALALLAAPVAAEVIGQMTTAEPISETRIAALPQSERSAWLAYLARSRALMNADKEALAKERQGRPVPPPPPTGPSGGAGMPLGKPLAWYAGSEARHAADTILSFQTPAGGWGKNVDRSGPARLPGQFYVPIENLPANAREDIKADDPNWRYVGTIDNGATTSELRFLARVQSQAPGPEGDAWRASFNKGIRYLLSAQFPNGGWPQIYPLQGGYHDAITFNDDAVTDVIELLSRVAARNEEFDFVTAALAVEARASVGKALRLILATQVVVDGKRTIWGQQHDALTLQPVGARNFEPASLSSYESAALLLFLMRQPDQSPAVRASVRDGIAWLAEHSLHEVDWARSSAGRQLIAKPGAAPLWARFYDLKTMKPIFADRDRSIHDNVAEISLERRNGYSWFSTGPQRAVDAWRESGSRQ